MALAQEPQGRGRLSTHSRLLAAATLVLLCGCREGVTSGLAATVNDIRITAQAVDEAAAELRPRAQGSEEDLRQVALDALISQAALASAAIKENLDEEPAAREAPQSRRLQVLARLYVDRHTSNIPAPSAQAVQAYYDAHPELFAERRVYRLQQLAIEVPDARMPELTVQYGKIRTLGEMVAWLDANGLRHRAEAVVKPAEELPMDLVQALARMQDGDTAKLTTPGGITIVQLTGIEDAPVSLRQAQPAIEKYLANQVIGASIQEITRLTRSRADIRFFPPFERPRQSP